MCILYMWLMAQQRTLIMMTGDDDDDDDSHRQRNIRTVEVLYVCKWFLA